jgi:hypothetical protein
MGSPIDEATFLQRARSRFGDRYDYCGIVYKSYKTPIRIRCRQHPVKLITITPEKHLTTTGGCKFCLRESRRRNPPARTSGLQGESFSRVVRLARRVRTGIASSPAGG